MNSDQTRTVADFLIADFENEMQATLRVIQAVPNGHLDYRPDSKSKTGLGLVRHIALEDEWLLNCIANGEFTPPPDDSDACGIMNPADAVARYKEKVPAALDRVRALSGRQANQRHRHVRHDPGARSQLSGDNHQAFGPPPRPAQHLPAPDGRQGPRDLRAFRRHSVATHLGA